MEYQVVDPLLTAGQNPVFSGELPDCEEWAAKAMSREPFRSYTEAFIIYGPDGDVWQIHWPYRMNRMS